ISSQAKKMIQKIISGGNIIKHLLDKFLFLLPFVYKFWQTSISFVAYRLKIYTKTVILYFQTFQNL
ncbi:uncharacterized protein METZ01_LOCUS392045, partial [marine metagenome]